MTSIDWRAFWISIATIIIALVIYGIVINPLIKKYRVQVVNDDDKDPSVKKAA